MRTESTFAAERERIRLSLADVEAFDPPRGSGSEKIARCPICQAQERSLRLNSANGLFNCKRASCGISGKLSDFWEHSPRRSKKERARMALKAAFYSSPYPNSPGHEIAPQSAFKREVPTEQTWREYLALSQLAGGTEAEGYLAGRGIPPEIAADSGARILRLPSGTTSRAYVAFPFCDRHGEPVALQARAIDGKPDPHRAYGTKRNGIFSTRADALDAEAVIICEAPIDALSLAACGFDAVALGGTTAPDWMAHALAFKRVILALDNDANNAGNRAAEALAPAMQSFGARTARLAPLRARGDVKSDWNALLQAKGSRALRAWIQARLRHIAHFERMPEVLSTRPRAGEINT